MVDNAESDVLLLKNVLQDKGNLIFSFYCMKDNEYLIMGSIIIIAIGITDWILWIATIYVVGIAMIKLINKVNCKKNDHVQI